VSPPVVQSGRVPWAIVRSGALAAINSRPSVLGTYLVYCAHANPHWEGWPSTGTITRCLGITAEAVRRARRELERVGLLASTGQARRRCPIYRLATDPQQVLGYRPPMGVGVGPQQARALTPNGRWDEQRNEQIAATAEDTAAAIAGAEVEKALRALAEAGVQRTAGHDLLAKRPSLLRHGSEALANVIRRERAKVAERGGVRNRVGLLLKILRDDGAELVGEESARLEAERAERERQAGERRKLEEERQQREAEAAERDRLLDTLSDVERDNVRQLAIDNASNEAWRRVLLSASQDGPRMREAMYGEWKRHQQPESQPPEGEISRAGMVQEYSRA